jgi:hypothetical protein
MIKFVDGLEDVDDVSRLVVLLQGSGNGPSGG